MKKSRIVLTVMAFLFAIVGAFASMVVQPPNATGINPVNQQCQQRQTQEGCTTTVQPIRCTVQFNSNTVDAFEDANPPSSGCVTPLFRTQ